MNGQSYAIIMEAYMLPPAVTGEKKSIPTTIVDGIKNLLKKLKDLVIRAINALKRFLNKIKTAFQAIKRGGQNVKDKIMPDSVTLYNIVARRVKTLANLTATICTKGQQSIDVAFSNKETADISGAYSDFQEQIDKFISIDNELISEINNKVSPGTKMSKASTLDVLKVAMANITQLCAFQDHCMDALTHAAEKLQNAISTNNEQAARLIREACRPIEIIISGTSAVTNRWAYILHNYLDMSVATQ